jgi:ABC-2 type transport system permease protein
MSKALTIASKEYKTYFSGPVAYVVAALFTFLMSWMFVQIFFAFAQRSLMMMMQGGGKGGMSLNDYVFGPHFGNVNVVLLIMIPALTMRLFAEEKKNRTLDLLMTSPLTATDIVLGKFLGGLGVVWTILAILAVYPLSASLFAHFDAGPVYTSFLGMALISAVYVSIGVFASSLTESVIIAYFLAFVIELFFWVIGWASQSMDGATAQGVFNYLSIVTHFGDFTKGMIDTSGVIYYLSLVFFFCFLSHRAVESARWR